MALLYADSIRPTRAQAVRIFALAARSGQAAEARAHVLRISGS